MSRIDSTPQLGGRINDLLSEILRQLKLGWDELLEDNGGKDADTQLITTNNHQKDFRGMISGYRAILEEMEKQVKFVETNNANDNNGYDNPNHTR